MPYRSVSLSVYLPSTVDEYYSDWLGRKRREHGVEAARAFVAAHPFMFGTSIDVAIHGYQVWLARSRRDDRPSSFAAYIGPRYERWRAERRAARAGKRPLRSA